MRCDPAGGVRPPSRPRWWGLLVAMTAMAAMSAAMTGAARAQAPIAPEQALLVCGGEEVRLYDLGVEGGAVRWSWSARGDARLPEDFKRGLADGDSERGRVFSLQNLAMSVMLMAGATAAGFLGGSVGIMPVLAFQGVLYVVAALAVLAAFSRIGATSDSITPGRVARGRPPR